MSQQLPFVLDAPHRRAVLGGEPMVFHCHHYNTFLQQSIRDAAWLSSEGFLVGAAAEVAYGQMSSLFRIKSLDDVDRRKVFASEVYRTLGFGTVDFSDVCESGGKIVTPSSHYAMAWRSKFGVAKEPVCYFARGWLAGVTAAIFDKPAGSYGAFHSVCHATGDDPCEFEVVAGAADYPVFHSVGPGSLSDHSPFAVPPTPVDYDGIFSALTGMPIVGDTDGNIAAFGVYLTRHYANYYNRISFEFLRKAVEMLGDDARWVAEPLLVEAGHVCAFNTFGGIMKSTEWNALIRPTLVSREDWVHGMVAAVNALGWGRWQVTDVSPERATFVLHDDYESVGYRAMYGDADHDVAYLARGAAMGIMDLVYLGDIADNPELTPTFYDRLFKSPDSYQSTPTSARAMGERVTSFEVVEAAAAKKAA